MPQGLKVQSQIPTDRDPAEVEDEDIQEQDDEEEEEEEEEEPEDEADDADNNEEPDGDEEVDDPDEVIRITGEAPGHFTEQPEEEQEDEPEAIIIKQEPQPLRRSARLAELASRNPISETMNFQTTNAGTYPAIVIATLGYCSCLESGVLEHRIQ